MSILTNPKYERFAQELAKGKTADEAYVIAGYEPNRGNASRLKSNENILRRIEELQSRAAARTEITLAGVLERLERYATKAEEENTPAGFNVARASLMDIAKLRGWIVEKRENGNPGDFDRMSDDELARYVADESARVGKELH